MQVEKKKPEGVNKKQARDRKEADALKKTRAERRTKMSELKKHYLQAGQKHWEAFEKSQKDTIANKRSAKEAGSIHVPEAPKLFLVIRSKGLNRIEPKVKKILRLFRLRQIHNAVFIRNTTATMNMLRVIEPWVTYGVPSRKTIHHLLYKRGFGKINGQRIPFTSNEVIEKGLGAQGIKCVEDLLHEIMTVGPHFKAANNFLWPFQLRPPKGGIEDIRHSYLNGGTFGPREEFINEYAKRMI
jgi:large subunit ribosomal protein L7e